MATCSHGLSASDFRMRQRHKREILMLARKYDKHIKDLRTQVEYLQRELVRARDMIKAQEFIDKEEMEVD